MPEFNAQQLLEELEQVQQILDRAGKLGEYIPTLKKLASS